MLFDQPQRDAEESYPVLLVHHSFARDHTVAFLSARGQRTSKHLSHHVAFGRPFSRFTARRAPGNLTLTLTRFGRKCWQICQHPVRF